jgi:aminotransferase in exopolysaccharide biosynthesis
MPIPKNKLRKRIALSEPYLKGREGKYLKECVRTGWVSSCGPFVSRFENLVAELAGSRYAVSVSSGTAALHTALLVLGIKEGSEVIVPTLTFIASVNAINYVGAHPVFMDCDDRLNIDTVKVEEFCSRECSFNGKDLVNNMTGRKVKAIIPVHVGGHPVNIEPLMALAKRFNLFVIEDAAESIGSYYIKGKYKAAKTGAIGHIGCYSFNGNKIITSGGGGMVVTNNKDWADRARYLINQAKDDPLYYIHDEIGNNYRMTNVEAAVGVAQVERLKEFIRIKRKNFLYYKKMLKGLPGISLIEEPPYGFSNYWQYSLVIDEASPITRDGLMKALMKNNIECRPLWKLNSIQKPYKDAQSYRIDKARVFSERVVSIPSSVGIKKDEMDAVLNTVKEAVK